MSHLEWKPYIINEHYIRAKTKFGFTTDSQTVSIVFFPDGKIYFNSINFPNDFMRPARFDLNFRTLTEELQNLNK